VIAAGALRAFLYGVGPADPTAFAAVTAVLVAVSLLACYLPTRRATRLNPNAVLRAE
jgi:macrolide transport system ATP-binding/permease protein